MSKAFDYNRRKSWQVAIGEVKIGGDNPVALQSMTNTPTLDTEASAAQAKRIHDAGADIVRLTAQTVAHARNLANIKDKLRAEGCNIPLVADIHFTPEAAFAAAEIVEKVRINPGNFVDAARRFKTIEYTDEEYASEIARIENKLVPLLEICKANNTALRIGVNHGSLSDRIMSRYGNTTPGMVESAMEFLRICHAHDFDKVVVSIKASNVGVMVATVRAMAKAMDAEGMHYPLHLGVTEAGDGEDGRVKSAVGIGTLLAEGLGDTIRVSLTEAPEAEVPVAARLVEIINHIKDAPSIEGEIAPNYDVINPERRLGKWLTDKISYPVVGFDFSEKEIPAEAKVIEGKGVNAQGQMKAQMHKMLIDNDQSPVILKLSYDEDKTLEEITLDAAVHLGAVLMAGFGDGLWIEAPHIDQEKLHSLALAILQAARLRISRTEFIACPGCGRTLFDLQNALAEVREATKGLPGLKIAVMGCIVNGPGEMADADYGYVGAAAGNVSLYRGKECVVKNVSSAEALPLLIDIIKSDGKWSETK